MPIIKVPCPDCGGVGTLEDRKGNEYPCPECKGRGQVEPERLRDFAPILPDLQEGIGDAKS